MDKNKIFIYTDGAAKGNPGSAGWGAVIMFHNDELKVKSGKLKVVEMGGRVAHATNNQMELTAPIEALKYVKKLITREVTSDLPSDCEVEIVSDSKYVILGITEWIGNWQKNNWRNANKKPVLNKELWEELYSLTQELKPKWTYVKGHNEDTYNERADVIATSFAEGEPVELRK